MECFVSLNKSLTLVAIGSKCKLINTGVIWSNWTSILLSLRHAVRWMDGDAIPIKPGLNM